MVTDDVKARIQTEIDMFEEGKKHRLGVCACCDELCKKKHEVHITEEWVDPRRGPNEAGMPLFHSLSFFALSPSAL